MVLWCSTPLEMSHFPEKDIHDVQDSDQKKIFFSFLIFVHQRKKKDQKFKI